MAETIYTGTVKKRVNSTLQPTLSTTYSVLLKNGCSIDNPVFYLSASGFSDNYVKWNDRYYYVTDITYETNTRTAVSCTLDVLATYKSDIIASTQFVSYSSVSGGSYLPDKRIPLKTQASVSTNSAAATFLSSYDGFYILSIISDESCQLYSLTEGQIAQLIDRASTWKDDLKDDFLNNADFSTVEAALESLTTAMSKSGAVGNAWANAPQCIRSCIWIPYDITPAVISGSVPLHLGTFDTNMNAMTVSAKPVSGSISVSIPWQYSDWRRVECEDIYLYLPLVGTISIPSENINHVNALTVKYSYTCSDGNISFEILAGTEVIGTYGASCSATVAIGINQQNGASQVLNALASGAQKMSSASLLGVAAGVAGTAYNVADAAMSRNLTCIGGIGGGAGWGLDRVIYCTSVAHPTTINPADMIATMGQPTMQPMALSSCTGYCQCANAHVATDAEYGALERIDAFLNTGFFIE